MNDRLTKQTNSASWDIVLVAIFIAAGLTVVSLLALLKTVAVLDLVPDTRDGMLGFFAFTATLSSFAAVLGYSAFPFFRAVLKVSFSCAVRWVLFPAFVVIPVFIYALIAVAYVHP